MRLPSIKSLDKAFSGKGKALRAVLETANRNNASDTLQKCAVIMGHGYFDIEYIPAGKGRNSPAILYVNAGDTYDTTLMKVGENFRIGDWGTIVERGNYA